MELTIDSARVLALAGEAAQRTGRSRAEAIEAALTMYLASLTEDRDRRRGAALAWLAGLRAEVDVRARTAVHEAVRDLHDEESGLPR